MADNLKQNISELIALIRYAQEKESVTNEMVAEILDYLNRVVDTTAGDCTQLRRDLELLSASLTDSLNKMKRAVDDAQSKAGNALSDAVVAIQKAEEAAKAAEAAGEAAYSLRGSVGSPGGIAPVGSDGKIPAEFLPKSSTSGGDGSGCECGDLTDKVAQLEQAVWPLELTVQASPSLIKIGVPTPVKFTFSAKRRGIDVSKLTVFGINESTLRKGITTYEETYTDSIGLFQIVPVTARYEGITTESAVTIRGTHPSFFGVVPADWVPGAEGVKALTELLVGSRSLTRSGISLDNGRIVVAYPASFGALTSIKDGNGYEVLGSYTHSELTVDGVNYMCYMLTEPVTAEGVKQVFS